MKLKQIMEGKSGFPDLKKWWTYEPDEIMSFVYWTKRQVPPTDDRKWAKAWNDIQKQLQKKFPKNESVNESNDYTVYHNTYSAAVQAAEKWAEGRGYTIDEDDWARQIVFGPKKPSKGKTNRATVGLFKNGKEQRKALHIQVYNRGTGGNEYELNAYIN